RVTRPAGSRAARSGREERASGARLGPEDDDAALRIRLQELSGRLACAAIDLDSDDPDDGNMRAAGEGGGNTVHHPVGGAPRGLSAPGHLDVARLRSTDQPNARNATQHVQEGAGMTCLYLLRSKEHALAAAAPLLEPDETPVGWARRGDDADRIEHGSHRLHLEHEFGHLPVAEVQHPRSCAVP